MNDEIREKKILVAGDAMLDAYHFGKVNRISPEAPVPVFLETGRERYAPGGAANVAVNVASIGMETVFCSMIGDDENGRILTKRLQDHDIDIDYVVKAEKCTTTAKLRYIGPGNQQLLRVDDETVKDISFTMLEQVLQHIKEHIDEFGVFILSDYQKGFLTEKVCQELIALANARKIPVLVDVKDTHVEKYSNATLLKPNQKELGELTGQRTDSKEEMINAAVLLCYKTNCDYVLATLGAQGMILVNREGLLAKVKSVASEVYDVTGAGDTSIAYLAAEINKGRSIAEAMVTANYAAGVQVSKVGTSIVYPEEVIEAMKGDGNGDVRKNLNTDWGAGLQLLRRKKEAGKRVVFTNGCFDILHVGHISYLKEAKKQGDILVVGINSDDSVKRLKGEDRPVNPLADRMFVLGALDAVDYVIPFEEDTPERLISSIRPDVLVKGGDYQEKDIVGADIVRGYGGMVKTMLFVEGRSTTALLHKIQEG